MGNKIVYGADGAPAPNLQLQVGPFNIGDLCRGRIGQERVYFLPGTIIPTFQSVITPTSLFKILDHFNTMDMKNREKMMK